MNDYTFWTELESIVCRAMGLSSQNDPDVYGYVQEIISLHDKYASTSKAQLEFNDAIETIPDRKAIASLETIT